MVNDGDFSYINNTFVNSPFRPYCSNIGRVVIYNNLFDRGLVDGYQHTNMIHHHNAYYNITGLRLQPPQPSDVILTNYTYEPGSYGEYYQPWALLDLGAYTAADLGLYHHITLPHLPIEGNSNTDIGFHYLPSKVYNNSPAGFSSSQGPTWYYLYTASGGAADYRNTNNYLPVYSFDYWWGMIWWGLTGNDYYCIIAPWLQQAGNTQDSVRVYIAPYAGKIRIRNVTFSGWAMPGNGILYRIYRNNELSDLAEWKHVCSQGNGGQPMAPIFLETQVQAGDAFYFQLNSNGNYAYDSTVYFQHIFYLDPIDNDNDGIPDYMEDRNGNGQYDAALGETNWQVADKPLAVGGSNGNGLQVYTPLK